MASITFALDNEVRGRTDKFSWVNWSEVAREEVLKKAERNEALEKLAELTKKSRLTEKDAKLLADKINKRVSERFLGAK